MSAYLEVGYSVNHDGEVYAWIGRIGSAGLVPGEVGERLDLGLLLAVADPAGYAGLRSVAPYAVATSEEQVRCILRYFAAGLRAHWRPLLDGESEAYERAREVRFWHAPDFPPEALVARPGPAPRWWV